MKNKCDICGNDDIVIKGVRSDGKTTLALCQSCKSNVEDAVDNLRNKRDYKGPYIVRPVGDGDFVLMPVGGGEL